MSEPKVGDKRRGNAGKGRPKGSANKTTVAVKDALNAAYEGIGGDKSLITWAKTNETEFYKLWAKMLPTEVKADVFVDIALADRLAAGRARVRGAG